MKAYITLSLVAVCLAVLQISEVCGTRSFDLVESASDITFERVHAEALDYISTLKLEDAQPPSGLLGQNRDITESSSKAAFVSQNQLVSFDSAVTGPRRRDVLDSTLLASLAANKVADKSKDPIGWFNKYQEVLAIVGWNIHSFGFEKFNTGDASLSINVAVMAALSELLTYDQLEAVKEMMNVLKDVSQPWYKVFTHNTGSDKNGAFVVASCTQEGENVVLGLGAFHFSSSVTTTNFFFGEYNSTNIDFSKSAHILTLNEFTYDQVRDAVHKKLGGQSNHFLDLPI